VSVDLLKVHDWEEWQTYRSDRSQPPWIKLHRRLLRDPKWMALSDTEKGHLVSIWMLAADNNGLVPRDPKIVQRLCGIEFTPDLSRLIDLGFLDAKLTPRRRQIASRATDETRQEPPLTPPSGGNGSSASPSGEGRRRGDTISAETLEKFGPGGG
jgi:hypothetical protein